MPRVVGMGVRLRVIAFDELRVRNAARYTEYYTGSITKSGADIGYLSSGLVLRAGGYGAHDQPRQGRTRRSIWRGDVLPEYIGNASR